MISIVVYEDFLLLLNWIVHAWYLGSVHTDCTLFMVLNGMYLYKHSLNVKLKNQVNFKLHKLC